MADYTLSAKITGDAKGLNSAVSSAESKLKSFADKIDSIGGGLKSIGKTLAPVTAAVTGVGTVAVKTAIDFTKLYESTMVVFEGMLGSKDAANKLYGSLLDTAKASTFSQETFLSCGKKLIGMGVSADNTKKYLQAATNAVSAFGGSAENIEGLTNAFAKASNSGKMSMEVINSMSDNGVQALKILGNQYGVTTEEMQKMISKGSVPAEEALGKLTDGMEKGTDGVNGYTKAMEGMAAKLKGGTLTGALDSIKSSVRSFSLNLTGINPTLKENDEGYAESQKRIEQLTAAFSTIAAILPRLATIFTGLTDGIGGFLDKMVGANVVLDEATGKWENVGGFLGDIQNKLDTVNPEKLKMVGDVILGLAAASPILIITGGLLQKLSSGLGMLGGVGKGLIGTMTGIGGGLTKLFVGFDGMNMKVFEGLSPMMKLKTLFSGIMSPMGLVVIAIVALVAAFAYLFTTNEEFRNSIMKTVNTVMSALGPALASIGKSIGTVAKTIGQTLAKVVEQLAPVFTQLVEIIGELIVIIAPFIAQLIAELAPIINEIVTVVGNIIASLMPALISIISAVMTVIQAIMPIIQTILTVVIAVISSIMAAVTPIIAFIGSVMTSIFDFISPIISFVADTFGMVATVIGTIWNTIAKVIGGVIEGISIVISGIVQVVTKVFDTIWGIISGVMNRVGGFITGVFDGIRTAWTGLTDFVNGIFDGVSNAVDEVVSGVKSVVNFCIDGINGAIDLINMIPGVDIGHIEHLLHGTDNWEGGFARMNEGGRGELVNLPNGTQVIPHDLSVQYAKESARANSQGGSAAPIDYDRLIGGIVDAISGVTIYNELVLDGDVVARKVTPGIDFNMGSRKRRNERR